MKIAITGATGFLGLKLSEELCKKGHQIVAIGRNLEKGSILTSLGCQFIQSSLEDLHENSEINNAFKGVEIVVHSAALSSPWGKKEDFISSNILGTRAILDFSIKYHVKKFIHISTPSLYFKFIDELKISEDKILTSPFASLYTESKFEAEKLVDEAFKNQNLFTITLRPRGIFGPGDTSLLPRLIKAAKNKRLPIIGNGKNIIDLTYVDNVVYAIEKCIDAPEICKGKKYNITNDAPIELWPFLNDIFLKLEIPISRKKIPFKIAYYYAWFMEIIYKHFLNNKEPVLTRYTAGLLAKNQTLSLLKAKTELGYSPLINMKEATERTIKWYKNYES